MRVENDERLWQRWPGSMHYGYARAFGDREEDLDIDFTGLGRPELTTAVLVVCLRPKEGAWLGDEVWSWTLAQRLQGLLAVTQASGLPPLALLQPCGNCVEAFEVNVELGMFERAETVTDFIWSPQPHCTLHVALPTGREQREWSRGSGLSLRTMARALVRGIDGAPPSTEWEIPDQWIDGLAEELEQRDPLTALEIETTCPACGAPARIGVDLEAELLAWLRARQCDTLNDIHRLASGYHWSEVDILELPAWRRRYYLAQLGAAGDA
jgi:hypothetical protein